MEAMGVCTSLDMSLTMPWHYSLRCHPQIVNKSRFHIYHILDILYWYLIDAWFYKGDKCGCFVLTNKWFFEVNLPYGQSKSWLGYVSLGYSQSGTHGLRHITSHLRPLCPMYCAMSIMTIGKWREACGIIFGQAWVKNLVEDHSNFFRSKQVKVGFWCVLFSFSVTGFGKFLPLCQLYEGIFSTWEFFETMLAIFKNIWANFHCWTLTKIGHLIKSSGHTVLLLAPLSLLCSKQWKQKMNFLIDSRFIFDENDEARLRQKTASHPVYLLSSMMGPLGAYLWNSVGINLRKDQIAMNSTFCKFWRTNKLGCCCCFVN